MSGNAEGTYLGRMRNFRIPAEDPTRVRADLALSTTSASSPQGDLRTYTENLAAEDPDAFGVSIVIDGDHEKQVDENGRQKNDDNDNPLPDVLRVKRLWAADVVDDPATADGLFSKTVLLSATASEQFDTLLREPDALSTIRMWAERYSQYSDADPEVLSKIVAALKALEAGETVVAPIQVRESVNPVDNQPKTHNKGNLPMTEEERAAQAKKDAELKAAHEKEMAEAVAQATDLAATNERERCDSIRALGKMLNASEEFIAGLIEGKVSLEDASKKFARLQESDLAVAAVGTSVQMGADEHGKFLKGMGDSMAYQAGLLNTGKPEDRKAIDDVRKSSLNGIGFVQLSRLCLAANGDADAHHMSSADACTRMLSAMQREQFGPGGAAQGSGDFANLLSNTLNKALARGWEVAGTTYQDWCASGSLNDFKQASLIKVTEFSDVERIPEGKAAVMGQFSDAQETAQLQTYGRLYSLTRQAMVNDDLNWFAKVPMRITASVRRLMNKRAYGLLYNGNDGTRTAFGGPNMNEDSTAMFTAAHGNLVAAGAGGAPTSPALNTAWVAMRSQTLPSPDGGRAATMYGNFKPRFILHGPQHGQAVFRLLSSAQLVGAGEVGAVVGSLAENPYGPGRPRNLTSIEDAEIDALSTNYPWYLAADSNLIPTVTVYTLNGRDAPTTKVEEARVNEVQGMSWMIMHDFVFAGEDFRGLYCNAGA